MKETDRKELASVIHGRDITRGYVDNLPILPPLNPTIRNMYSQLYNGQAFRAVLQDSQVISTLRQRELAVVGRDWQVLPGGEDEIDHQAAEFLEMQLKKVGWDHITELMLRGRFFGYSVAEVVWARDDNRVVFDCIKVRDRYRFGFDPMFKLKLLTTQNPDGEELPERKFWHFACGADHDDEPYGQGLAHYLYWPALFKKNSMKFWLIFQDRFGQPLPAGKYGRGATDEEIRTLEEAIQNIHTDRGIVLPEDMQVELIEAARAGTQSYDKFIEMIDSAISKIVLGQTMTTDDGSSKSQSETHYKVRKDIVESDAKLVNDSFNETVVRWLIDYNFEGAAYPRVERMMEEKPDTHKLAMRDRFVSELRGKFTDEYITNTYGVELAEEVGMKPGNIEFAEGEELDDVIKMILDNSDNDSVANLESIESELLKGLVEKGEKDPVWVMGRLVELYPTMDSDALEESLEKIFFVASLWAETNARRN